ncbi:DUF2156 domain-containing protein [Fusibacter bizertensis]
MKIDNIITFTTEYEQLVPFSPDQYEKLLPYYAKYTSQVHELNLTNLVIWYKKYNLHFVELGGYLWYVYHPEDTDHMTLSEPVGDNQDFTKLNEATTLLFDYFQSRNVNIRFRHVGESFKVFLETFQQSKNEQASPTFKFSLEITTNEDDYDYIYLVEELSSLSGNKFHKKKNHLNQFQKNYADRYRMTPIDETNVEDALTASKNWCIANGCGETYDLCHEYNGIYRILANWQTFSQRGLVGILIYLDELPVAFSFGEPIQNDTFLVHIEKADADVMGAYTAINHALANLVKDRCTYVNREQDMGIEGIKKAKQSYHPVKLIPKYNINFNCI